MKISRWKLALGSFVLITSQAPIWNAYKMTMGNSGEPVMGPILFILLLLIPLAGATILASAFSQTTKTE
jgi:hypothetical protein